MSVNISVIFVLVVMSVVGVSNTVNAVVVMVGPGRVVILVNGGGNGTGECDGHGPGGRTISVMTAMTMVTDEKRTVPVSVGQWLQ